MRTTMTALAAAAMAALASAQDTAKDEAIRKLDGMKVTIDFQEIRLAEAIEYLRDATGLNLHLEADEQRDDPVTLRLKDLSLKSVLKLMLKPRGLTAGWRDGVIVIHKDDPSARPMVTRVYDIRDLMVKLQDFPGPRIELNSGAQSQIVGITITMFEEPKVLLEDTVLVELIEASTGGSSWSDGQAEISLVNGLLIVRQSKGVHTEIAGLLDGLRRMR